jgi:hypothetical protein
MLFFRKGGVVVFRRKPKLYRKAMVPGKSHGLINYIDTKASKKLACEGTLRQVLIRVFIMEKQPVMLVFSTQLCDLLPL